MRGAASRRRSSSTAPGDAWWRAQITPLGGGSILAAYWNITAQKLHERSLRASERLNREILSGLQEGVVVVDTDARVVVANEAAAELFGVPLDELMDRPLSAIPVDLLDDRGHLLADRAAAADARAARARRSRAMVVRFVRRDGSLLWVEVHANPLLPRRRRSSTARSPPTTTSPRAWSRTGARATRPTPTR